ncbi:UMP kinase [Rhodomicrobium vannielii ATCC 17100]|uniref:UMP kinase n=1 Tax=Rhodomicrobium vannielii TaxID=1069 RepID=UPI00191B7CD3|nr:UMP kinase [Rhodomicrobium vannielii]MBJ7534904.1 UMP kinase [Rhodomicrobium vannielii ATCC 17100]
MAHLPFTRPLIKISGEALMGSGQYGIDPQALDAIARDIADLADSGKRIALVVGGGNIYRGLAGSAKGMDRVKADFMGMLATVMNGVALQQTLVRIGQPATIYSGLPVPTICATFSRDAAVEDLEAGKVVVLAGGTGNPFFTTDTTAALRAAELGCDSLLKATQVDGIYSADPKKDPRAERYDRLTFSDVLARDLKVMDAAAIALARDNAIPVVVFSLHEQGAIGKVMRGEALCSVVGTDADA